MSQKPNKYKVVVVKPQNFQKVWDSFAEQFNALAVKLEKAGIDSAELVDIVNTLQELERIKVSRHSTKENNAE